MDRDQIIDAIKTQATLCITKEGEFFYCALDDNDISDLADKIKALEPTEEEILKECDIYHEKVIKGWRKYHRAFILGANFVRNFKR